MSAKFTSFVVLAGQRTGSNFVEQNINAYPELKCWGEVFNPYFIGNAHFVSKNRDELLGVTQIERDEDPFRLLTKIMNENDKLNGFRLFFDHDARIIEHMLNDPSCAKIVLTRNPLDSYISRRIANKTGQWWLGDDKGAVSAKAQFDPEQFQSFLANAQSFQMHIQHVLQTTGQTAFYIHYDDLGDIAVFNGLAKWLAGAEPRKQTVQKTKVQNPKPLSEKVANFEEMKQALTEIDHFGLNRTPNFEPTRQPMAPSYILAREAPVQFLPMPGGPFDNVVDWLAALDGDSDLEGLSTGHSQPALRKWMSAHPGHRRFTVLRHPLSRLHGAFCTHILYPGPQAFGQIRQQLRDHYELDLPPGAKDETWTPERHRESFLKFIKWADRNLGGQTSLRVPPEWSSQSALLQGFAKFNAPDLVLREEELAEALPALARAIGRDGIAPRLANEFEPDYLLAEIHDAEFDDAIRATYRRDYMELGFGDWTPPR